MTKEDERVIDPESGDDMKVPIDDASSVSELDDVTAGEPQEELDEEAMVEAAIRAGEQAAEEELEREARGEEEKLRQERNELLDLLAKEQDVAAAAEKEAKDALAKLQRLQADWENFRRRTRQEREVERERAAEKLVLGLLPVLDDLERAVDHARGNQDATEQLLQFVDGVNQVHDKMVGVLEREGVEVIDPAGEPFEPLSHQAVGREENAEAFDETVAQVYQRGYRMGGKVIRPAMVTVTYGGPKRPQESESETEESAEQ